MTSTMTSTMTPAAALGVARVAYEAACAALEIPAAPARITCLADVIPAWTAAQATRRTRQALIELARAEDTAESLAVAAYLDYYLAHACSPRSPR